MPSAEPLFKRKKRIVIVSGVRPNIPKIAPLIHELRKHPDDFEVKHIYTGQHFSPEMSQNLFEELDVKPDITLKLDRTKEPYFQIGTELFPVLRKEKPDLVLAIGGVKTTQAVAHIASMVGIPIMHVESYVRIGEKPGEYMEDGIVEDVDELSDVAFTTTKQSTNLGNKTLENEGKAKKMDIFRGPKDGNVFDPFKSREVCFSGNLMADCIHKFRDKIDTSHIMNNLGVEEKQFALISLHRDKNVDKKENLQKILKMISEVPDDFPVLWSLHHRTRMNLEKFGLMDKVNRMKNVKVITPPSYFDFIHLTDKAKLLIGDSGGSQGECSILNTPYLLLMPNAYDKELEEKGTVIPVGLDHEKFKTKLKKILRGDVKPAQPLEGWDGKAAERMVDFLKNYDLKKAWMRIAEEHRQLELDADEKFEREPKREFLGQNAFALTTPTTYARPKLIASLLDELKENRMAQELRDQPEIKKE